MPKKPRKLPMNFTFCLSTDDYLKILRMSRKAHLTMADYVRSKLGIEPTRYKRRDGL